VSQNNGNRRTVIVKDNILLSFQDLEESGSHGSLSRVGHVIITHETKSVVYHKTVMDTVDHRVL